ncbi:uncharacterized protein LOC129570731 [Sitodiplosis mosellana]|uniref:uncharacterized protein LOC129570731 n=1 Tax=Sitodiplosis mosellana TaxID=263140 RepID=UPI00244453C5|nr:uncharacterized protein LOC129570731 [Sitodiplosis mosellana]
MQSFLKVFFVVAFITTTSDIVLADTGGVNIGGVLYALLDTLNTALLTGDIKTIVDTLKAIADIIREALPKFASEKTREFFNKALDKIGELIENLPKCKTNLQEVRTFANEIKEKLRQRLIDRIKRKST